MSNYSDFYGLMTYRDPLLFYKIENLDWWTHRDWAVRRDPFLKKFINGIDKAIFQEKPIFIPDILGSDTEVESPEKEGNSLTPLFKDVREEEINENRFK